MIVEILMILLIIFLVYASCSIRSNIYLKVFCKKQTEEKIVAITFDDGPDAVQTPKVLQVLKEQQIPACFFCIGHKVQENEEGVYFEATIQNNGNVHKRKMRISDRDIINI